MNGKEIYCVVYGDVQGVFYRDYVKKAAREFSITGYAKNLDDGTVEIVGQGSEENLRKFLEKASAGPETAQVDNITVSWGPIPDDEKFSQFDAL